MYLTSNKIKEAHWRTFIKYKIKKALFSVAYIVKGNLASEQEMGKKVVKVGFSRWGSPKICCDGFVWEKESQLSIISSESSSRFS